MRVGLGRGAVRNPRDIVDLLVEAAGLPSREVGFIALGEGASYAEVPFDFAKRTLAVRQCAAGFARRRHHLACADGREKKAALKAGRSEFDAEDAAQ